MIRDADKETDILTIYPQVQEIIGSGKGPVHGAPKPGEQRRSSLGSSQARKMLDWQPQVSLVQGLTRTVHAFQESFLMGKEE